MRLSSTHPSHVQYETYKNVFNNTKKQAKEQYYKDTLHPYKSDIKNSWKILKPLLGKHTNKSDICKTFFVDGMNTSDPKNIANGFCTYFANVGSSLANQIPQSTVSPQSHVEREEN